MRVVSIVVGVWVDMVMARVVRVWVDMVVAIVVGVWVDMVVVIVVVMSNSYGIVEDMLKTMLEK